MSKQTILATQHHTCTCPDNEIKFNWATTKVIDVDFEKPNKEAPNGRVLWALSSCSRCKGKILHGSSFCDYRTVGEKLLADAKHCAESWISSQRRVYSVYHEEGCFNTSIDKLWSRYLKQPTFEFVLASTEHGYADYDVTGDDLVKRICIGHKTQKGEVVNVYCHDGSKRGAIWQGSVEKTLKHFLTQIALMDHSSNISDNTEYFPSASREEVGSIMMKDIVGDYDTPDQVPEWTWIEKHACFNHARNGQDGIWEFVLNLSYTYTGIPALLEPVINEAVQRNLHYIIFHQGT